MRVLFLLNDLAPGGAETSTVANATQLLRLGVQPTIVTTHDVKSSLTTTAKSAGIPLISLQAGSIRRQVSELRKMLQTGDFSIIHTALFRADILGRVAAWGTGVPVIASFVNTGYDGVRFTEPDVSRTKVRVSQLIDMTTGRLMVTHFHALSDGLKRENVRALRLPPDRVTIAERGRDPTVLGRRTPERRQRIRDALGIDSTAPVVLNLARLDWQKAQTDLVAAAIELADRYPDLVVLIAGKDGLAGDAVRGAIAADPLARRCVRLLGHRTDIGDLLCAADVMALSSIYEGTAGVTIEAMALETPIVSTGLVGVEGILEHGSNALLVNHSDPSNLAAGIARILDDDDLATRLAERGFQDFNSRFTLETAAEKLLTLYRSLL